MRHAPLVADRVIAKPLHDPFGIGRSSCARIEKDIAMREMASVVLDAFGRHYVNPLVREALRARFATYRAKYERAKSILDTLQ